MRNSQKIQIDNEEQLKGILQALSAYKLRIENGDIELLEVGIEWDRIDVPGPGPLVSTVYGGHFRVTLEMQERSHEEPKADPLPPVVRALIIAAGIVSTRLEQGQVFAHDEALLRTAVDACEEAFPS